ESTNPDIKRGDSLVLPRGSLQLQRSRFLFQGCCHELLRIRNFHLEPANFYLHLLLDADYVDLFEVRGQHRSHRGDRLPSEFDHSSLALAYRGLDQVIRRTRISCDPAPDRVAESFFRFSIHLEPKAEIKYRITIACELDGEQTNASSYDEALAGAAHRSRDRNGQLKCRLHSANEQFN